MNDFMSIKTSWYVYIKFDRSIQWIDYFGMKPSPLKYELHSQSKGLENFERCDHKDWIISYFLFLYSFTKYSWSHYIFHTQFQIHSALHQYFTHFHSIYYFISFFIQPTVIGSVWKCFSCYSIWLFWATLRVLFCFVENLIGIHKDLKNPKKGNKRKLFCPCSKYKNCFNLFLMVSNPKTYHQGTFKIMFNLIRFHRIIY